MHPVLPPPDLPAPLAPCAWCGAGRATLRDEAGDPTCVWCASAVAHGAPAPTLAECVAADAGLAAIHAKHVSAPLRARRSTKGKR